MDFEQMAQILEATGDFRVLRRLRPHASVAPPLGVELRTGVFLDVETTGLDPARNEIIELAMVPFEYAASSGQIFRVGEPLQQLNEPRDPIPSEITALTGLTDEMVAGHKLDVDLINATAETAALIIAHNAAFDRPFAERVSAVFKVKPWACSMCGVPWKEEGIEGRRLSDLLARFGLFFDGHRAAEDCAAAIELLTMQLPKSGKFVMGALLEEARTTLYRISAEGAPFESREELKVRGYRWNAEVAVGPRAWWIEVAADQVEGELEFLEREIFHGTANVPIQKITAFERFSTR